MAIIPKITVTQVDNVPRSSPGIAGKVAIVAEFSKDLDKPVHVKSYPEALEAAVNLPITAESPIGDQVLDPLFRGGVTDLIIRDITPATPFNPTGVEIVDAATSLEENYDILIIPYELADTNLIPIRDYLLDRFEDSHPACLVAPITRTTVTDYRTTAEIFKDGALFGLVLQAFTVNDTEYTLEQSAAYYCGLIAKRKVDASFTMKKLDGVEAVDTEYTFAEMDMGYSLVEAGYPVVKCLNRADKTFVVVNSRLPHTVTSTDGTTVHLDLYMERTINYIINLFKLEQFFGEKNNPVTLDAVEQRLARIKQDVVEVQQLVNDIVYSVEKVNRDCIRTNIEEIVFDGVITEIEANITYDVL